MYSITADKSCFLQVGDQTELKGYHHKMGMFWNVALGFSGFVYNDREPSPTVRIGELLEWLYDYRLLKKDSA